MSHFVQDQNIFKDPCDCIKSMTYEDLLNEQENNYLKRYSLPKGIHNIFIYSYLDICKIGVNTIGLIIKRGFNRTCLCLLAIKDVNLSITTYFKSNLVQIDTKVDNSVAFVLTQRGHELKCINSKVPSLYEHAYASLYLNGINETSIRNKVIEEELPKTIYEDKPETFIHVPYFQLSAVRGYYNPIHMPSIIGCLNPHVHLKTTSSIIQEMEEIANLFY
jgi:hypothetical protein